MSPIPRCQDSHYRVEVVPVVQKWRLVYPRGSRHITLDDWVIENCTREEQQRYAAAKKRQLDLREEAMKQGKLSLPEGRRAPVYEWKDREARAQGKSTDPEWGDFWIRWVEATGVQQIFEEIEIPGDDQ